VADRHHLAQGQTSESTEMKKDQREQCELWPDLSQRDKH